MASRSLKRFRTLYWFIRMFFRIPDLFGAKLRLHENHVERWLVPLYFKYKYIPKIKDMPARKVSRENPETIWQFWTPPPGRETPPIVGACLGSVEKYRGDKKHVIITEDKIGDHVDMPGYIMDLLKNPRVSKAHFADILRLALLHEHGGIWMDATDYMTAMVPKFIDDAQFFVMHTRGSLKGAGSEYSFIQNCFIKSDKGAYLLDAWYKLLLEYWQSEDRAAAYFQHQLMFKAMVMNDPRAKIEYQKMPYVEQAKTHLLSMDKMLEPFDAKKWEEIKRASFFQKLRHQYSDYPKGSFVDILSREKI